MHVGEKLSTIKKPQKLTRSQIIVIRQLSNEMLRWVVVGVFNVAVFWSTYGILYTMKLFNSYNEVYSWAIAFIIGSVVAHYTHRKITFRSDAKYLPSFWRAMIVYATSFTLSTTSEYFLVEELLMNHLVALVINTAVFGAMGFFGMRFFAFKVPMLSNQEDE